MASTDSARPYRRAGCAALASLLLHGAVITAWHLHSPQGRRAQQAPRQAMQVQWITAPPEAQAPPAPRPSAKALVQAKAPSAPGRAEHRPQPPAAQSPGRAGTALPMTASIPGAAQPDPVAAAPQRPASDSGAADVPVRWSAEAVGRADRQEREWQRRHGGAPAAQLAAGMGSSAAAPPDAVLSTREWRGGDGARVAQVQDPGGGTYCVRLPSANRLPDQGAAPRVAPVSNCP